MVSFDLRDALIPFSLLQVANTFRRMAAGEIMEILASNAEITTDLRRILPPDAYEICSSHETEDAGRPNYRLQLKKKHNVNPQNPKENYHV